MEDQEAARVDGVAAPPFSELIRDWLDEGDRLDAQGVAAPAVEPAGGPGPFGRALRRLGAQAARHRLTVMAGVGLLPLALFAATHHGAPLPATATVTVVAVAEAPPSPASPLVHERQAISAESSLAPAVPVVAAPPVLASKTVGHPAKLHHHHHHRLAQRTDRHRR